MRKGRKSVLPGIVAVAVIVAGLIFVGPYFGLGKVWEKAWKDSSMLGSAQGSLGMAWGIKPTSGSKPGAIWTGATNLDSGATTVYAQGTLTVTNAQTVSPTVTYYVRVVRWTSGVKGTPGATGSTDPVSTTLNSGTKTATLVDQGGGRWTADLNAEWNSLTYAGLGIPNVGNTADLECYVYISLTVDGKGYVIQSWATTNGNLPVMHIEHTSDAGVSFNWGSQQMYYD